MEICPKGFSKGGDVEQARKGGMLSKAMLGSSPCAEGARIALASAVKRLNHRKMSAPRLRAYPPHSNRKLSLYSSPFW